LGEVLETNLVPGLNECFVAIGAALNTLCVQFVLVAEVDLEGGLDATQLEGYPLNPLQRAGLVKVIRYIFEECGFDPPTLGCKLPAPKAKAATEPPTRAQQTEEAPADQLVSLSDVLDQAARGTAKLMTFTELAACRARYAEVAGDHPQEEHTPSAEQLSALRAVLVTGKAPYADFGVWGPYGSRLARFRKTEAAVFVGNELVHKRADGPESFESWLSAWELFSVAMVSLNAASIGTMNRYKNGLVQLHKLFPKMWPIMATTDVIVRSERWGRLREQIETNVTMGAAPIGWDPARPWDCVVSQSAYGRDGLNATWWQSHFVLPCTLAHSAGVAASTIRDIEGYPTGGSTGSSSQQHKPPPKGQPAKSAPIPPAGADNEICLNYNSRSGRCAKDGPCAMRRQHKCDVCGGNHRSIDVHGGPAEKHGKKGQKRFYPAQGGDQKRR